MKLTLVSKLLTKTMIGDRNEVLGIRPSVKVTSLLPFLVVANYNGR
jgi:hypothetical protein